MRCSIDINHKRRSSRSRPDSISRSKSGWSGNFMVTSKHALRGLLVLLLVSSSLTLRAERLPLKSYTTADGLPHDQVNRIVPGSGGFLWFCTQGGLSRFDGYTFTNFGTAQGLPEGGVNELWETRAAEYLVATEGGLIRFDPAGRPLDRNVSDRDAISAPPMFVLVPPPDDDRFGRTTTVLREGRDGTIWVGTRRGVYRLEGTGSGRSLRAVEVGLSVELIKDREVTDLLEDQFGTLWIATRCGLSR